MMTDAQTTSRVDLPPVDVLHSEHDYTMATCGVVFVVIFHHETTVGAAATLEQLFTQFARSHPHAVLLTVVEESAPMPSAAARDALATFMAQADAIRISGVAYEGTGFRAAAVRSVVTGLTMLARQGYPHKVFATVEETARWVHEQGLPLGLPLPSGPALSEAVARARRDLSTG